MDAYMYQTRMEALAQQVSGPFTAPVMQDALRSLLALFEDHYDAYMALTNDYRRLTATLSRLTETCQRLTAERETLVEAAADAYEAGLKAYLAYTNDFLQAHQDAWEQYLHTRYQRALGGGPCGVARHRSAPAGHRITALSCLSQCPWIGLLAALQLPHSRVRPHVWKKALGLGKDKEASRLRAMQLCPMADLWHKKDHVATEMASQCLRHHRDARF